MKHLVTIGLVLARTDYGEADRILTILTIDQGKISVLAKGSRRIKSKLAGGIELLSVSELTYLPGRTGLGTLTSARMQQYYSNIVKNIDATMLAYELLKRLNRCTEDAAGPEYFELLRQSLAVLDQALPPRLVELWFNAHLLQLSGHQPNLHQDKAGQALAGNQMYNFNFDSMKFLPDPRGMYSPSHIKFLRLVFGASDPAKLQNVINADEILPVCSTLMASLCQYYIN